MYKNLSGVWMNMQIYIARFPLSNEINNKKRQQCESSNASDYSDVDVCMRTAVQ